MTTGPSRSKLWATSSKRRAMKGPAESGQICSLGDHAAILNLSSGGALNEARANVGIALSNLIHDHGPPTPQSIDKAKRAIEAWIRELEASPAA